MKKVLSVLLAVLVLCGVGAVSASAGGGINPDAYRRGAMNESYNSLWDWPLGSEDLNAALKEGKSLDNLLEDLRAVYSLYNGWFQVTAWETFAHYDEVLAEYFNSAFVAEFKTWQTALVNYSVAYAEFLIFLGLGDGAPPNQYEEAIQTKSTEKYDTPFDNGELTLAEATIVLQELEAEIRALIDTLGNPEPEPDPEPVDKIFELLASFLPESAANVLTCIVKYLFFGWLWGRWL
ncbi:MAG: hypothetical protein LBB75_07320 [Oscillospiraceae bacterium]|jgi:hypothetical protein|nr:hypothetical protein [Oscillospiraceae bacterium]